jgi:hypothetical protein
MDYFDREPPIILDYMRGYINESYRDVIGYKKIC